MNFRRISTGGSQQELFSPSLYGLEDTTHSTAQVVTTSIPYHSLHWERHGLFSDGFSTVPPFHFSMKRYPPQYYRQQGGASTFVFILRRSAYVPLGAAENISNNRREGWSTCHRGERWDTSLFVVCCHQSAVAVVCGGWWYYKQLPFPLHIVMDFPSSDINLSSPFFRFIVPLRYRWSLP